MATLPSCYQIVGGESESGLTITNCLEVYENGILKDSTLLASDIRVNDEGLLQNITNERGYIFVNHNSVAKKVVLNGDSIGNNYAYLYLSNNSSADGVTVNDYGRVEIYDNALINNAIVNQGGYLFFMGAVPGSLSLDEDEVLEAPQIAGINNNIVINEGGVVQNQINTTINNVFGNGGVIFNSGNLHLINSSFYGSHSEEANLPISLDDDEENDHVVDPRSLSKGGAISNSWGTLTITADGGESVFSGNYVDYKYSNLYPSVKVSNAIYSDNGLVVLEAKNDGVIRIDDGILLRDCNMTITGGNESIEYGYKIKVSQSDVDNLLQNMEDIGAELAPGANPEKDDKFDVFLRNEEGNVEEINTLTRQEDGSYEVWGRDILGMGYGEEEVLTAKRFFTEQGFNIISQNDGFKFYNPENGVGGAIIKQVDETYRAEFANSSEIFYENSGRVEINGQITTEGGGEIVQNGDTNVFFGENSFIDGFAYVIGDKNWNTETLGPPDGPDLPPLGTVNNAKVVAGGGLYVGKGGVANNTTVFDGGELVATEDAILNNLLAKAGAYLELDFDTILRGDIVIDSGATMDGGYDYSEFFKDSVQNDSLTLVGGINEAVEEALKNTAENKTLTLADGNYNISSVNGKGTEISGWDKIVVGAYEEGKESVVKLEDDLILPNANSVLAVTKSGTLDLSGHSPLDVTIDGNIENSGTINFWHETDDADDKVVITGNYIAKDGASVMIDINPDSNKSDLIVVEGDVSGKTKIVAEATSENKPSQKIEVVRAMNDDPNTGAYFEVAEVKKSPFKWNTIYENNAWYMGTTDIVPDGSVNGYGTIGGENNNGLTDKPLLVGEMMAYMGLYDAGFEQVSSLNRAIGENIGKNYMFGRKCQGTVCKYVRPAKTAWAVPAYSQIDVKSPYEYEAKISGVDAGFDIDADGYNKWGIMASYRQGNYDFSGKGDDYSSDDGAEIDIDSYIVGLYGRRDKYDTKIVGAIYAGMQQADIHSDKGIKGDSDGYMFGAMIDVSHAYRIIPSVVIEPELVVSYQMLNYDNIKDSSEKEIKLEAGHKFEIELGAKIAKEWNIDKNSKVNIYVKPGVIQRMYAGGKLDVEGLESLHTLEDRTIGRVAVGADAQLNTRWNIGGAVAYGFGSDYEDTSLNLDVKYRW